MITKISKIKQHGLFTNYRWTGLEDFKRYNLIYGLNGTGKTTLSRLFDIFESGNIEGMSKCEYEFVDSSGARFTHEQPFNQKIRVFNQDFIAANVQLVNGTANPIVILGEDSQETLQRIKNYEELLNGTPNDPDNIGLLQQLQNTKAEIQTTEKDIATHFTNVARTIGATVGGDAIRNYTKTNSEREYRNLETKALLPEAEYDKQVSISKQVELPKVAKISSPSYFENEKKLDSFESLETALAEATELMMETVESVSIDHLKDNSDISEWVEQGLHIHIEHKSDKCEFCEQVLSEKRISQLSQYFNEADKKLKSAIAENLETLRSVHRSLKEVALHDQARLYSTLQEEYSAEVEKFDGDKEELLENIKHVAEQLKAKKAQTWEKIELENTVSTEYFVAGLGRINTILEKHNTYTDELETNKAEALLKVKNHHFTEIYDEVTALEQQLQTLKQQKEIIEDGDTEDDSIFGINQVKAKIVEYRTTISSAHSGCENLNAMLVELLGRNEIIFEANEEEDGNVSGYSIKRGDEVALHISDGEQAAIAFAYFCIHLNDQTFSLVDGIVVIDDPVSSLDYGMLFRVCSHVENKLIKAKQLFILTHNYDFFNQMKKWFYNSPRINNTDARGADEETDERGRLMMLNSVYDTENECRTSEIADLDELLRDYESEYHYLFKKLIQFDFDNPPEEGITLRAIYDYPNMARKMLECYLSFRCPKKGGVYSKLMGLKSINADISSEDIGYVYGFVNSHSHLDTKSGLIQFDPTLSLNGRDSIYKALNLIELSDPEHYKAMKKCTGTNTN